MRGSFFALSTPLFFLSTPFSSFHSRIIIHFSLSLFSLSTPHNPPFSSNRKKERRKQLNKNTNMARKSASPSTSRRCTLLVLLVAAAALSVATLSATPVAAQPIFPRPRQGPLHRLFGGGTDAEETPTPVAAPAPAPTTTRPALTSIVGNNNVVINNIFVLNDEDITETMDQVIEKNSLALETLVQDAIEDMPATVFRFTRGRDSEDPRLTNVWTKKKQVIEMLQNGITTMGPRAFAAKELPRLLRVIANMLNGPGTRENPSVYKDIAWRLHSVPFGKRKGKKNTSHTLQQAAELYHSCNTAFTQTVSDVHKTTLFPMIRALTNEVKRLPNECLNSRHGGVVDC